MKSTADNYFESALEHLARAQEFFISHRADGDYLTHYFAGLSVECMLRAYLRVQTDQFESNHSLDYLAKKSNFYDLVPVSDRSELANLFFELTLRWNANHRYFSKESIRHYLHDIRADARQKGEQFHNNARFALTSADRIIEIGVKKWKR